MTMPVALWGNCCSVVLLPWVVAASLRSSSTRGWSMNSRDTSTSCWTSHLRYEFLEIKMILCNITWFSSMTNLPRRTNNFNWNRNLRIKSNVPIALQNVAKITEEPFEPLELNQYFDPAVESIAVPLTTDKNHLRFDNPLTSDGSGHFNYPKRHLSTNYPSPHQTNHNQQADAPTSDKTSKQTQSF